MANHEYICLDCGDYFTSAEKPRACPHCISDRLVALTYRPTFSDEELERRLAETVDKVAGSTSASGERL
jgi:DNA-directed RNA polymerase subunit RPC12/RpoP